MSAPFIKLKRATAPPNGVEFTDEKGDVWRVRLDADDILAVFENFRIGGICSKIHLKSEFRSLKSV